MVRSGQRCSLTLSRLKETDLTDSERIEMLEKALIKYVELYGFIDEARAYYIRQAINKNAARH